MKSKYLWSKLGINLLVIVLLVALIFVAYHTFSHHWQPVIGVISLLVLLGLFIYSIILANNKKLKYQHPKFTLTLLALIGLFLILTFAGVQPMSSWKDRAFNSLQSYTPPPAPPIENKSIIGKWQQVTNNRVSIMSPTIVFFTNGTVILDDGATVVTGSYDKLSDEYIKINIETSFFGIPITSMDTLKYQITGDKLIIRISGQVFNYQRIND